MAKTKKKPAAESNPFDTPLYTPWDVARYLRLPIWAVAALTGRGRAWLEPEFFFHHFWQGVPWPSLFADDVALPPGETDTGDRITFRRFADLFVRAGVLQALAEWPRGSEPRAGRWDGSYRTILRGLEDTYLDPVPFDESPAEGRVERVAAAFLGRLNEPQAALVRKHLTTRLDRVETTGGVPVRVYPPSREPGGATPRLVVLDPLVRFGRPTLAGRGLPTDVLFERYQAGDSPAELAADYDLPTAEVDEAIRFESRPAFPTFPFSGW